jgi:hypothetical protein
MYSKMLLSRNFRGAKPAHSKLFGVHRTLLQIFGVFSRTPTSIDCDWASISGGKTKPFIGKLV